MSTSDIEITSVPDGSDLDAAGPGTALSTHVVQRGAPSASPLAPKEKEALLKSALRKRWWLLLICAGVSFGVAFYAAKRYEANSWEVEGKLLCEGLPELTRTKAYSMQSVETHAQLLESPTYLNIVIEKRKLGNELDVMGLQSSLKVTPDGRAKTITLVLTWNDVGEAVAMLNDLMDMYVEQVVVDRRKKATEHVKHAEQELFRAEAVEANCRKLLGSFREKMGVTEYEQQQIPETLRQYTTALNAAEIAVTALTVRIKELDAAVEKQTMDLKRKVRDAKVAKIKAAAEKYDHGSQRYIQLEKVWTELAALDEKSPSLQAYAKWKEAVDAVGRSAFNWVNLYTTKDLEEAATQLDHVTADREKAQLDLKAETAKLKELNGKIDQTKKRMETANNAMRPQAEERRSLEDELTVATNYKHEVKSQLQALKQIAGSQVREFSVAARASWNGSATSTFKKLLVAVFVATALVLSAPVFGCEYYLNRESPADETARLFNLPLLSRGAFSSRLARGKAGELTLTRTGDDGEDSVRLLALRIQQSLRRPGAVIVFSPLEHDESPVSLICKLAVCFAEREELVLVVDASGTLAQCRTALASLFAGTPHRTPEGSPLDPTLTDGKSGESHMATFGVSDFMCHEELELGDLILPTRFPRVDCIHGGVVPIPREGLASRRMTELLEQSRGRYTMILVAGPSTRHQTDVQLLAARADGMLFTVSPNSPISSRGHEVIQDLIDLNAPVMGLIG